VPAAYIRDADTIQLVKNIETSIQVGDTAAQKLGLAQYLQSPDAPNSVDRVTNVQRFMRMAVSGGARDSISLIASQLRTSDMELTAEDSRGDNLFTLAVGLWSSRLDTLKVLKEVVLRSSTHRAPLRLAIPKKGAAVLDGVEPNAVVLRSGWVRLLKPWSSSSSAGVTLHADITWERRHFYLTLKALHHLGEGHGHEVMESEGTGDGGGDDHIAKDLRLIGLGLGLGVVSLLGLGDAGPQQHDG
jgi:hypothetical protein